MREANGGYPPAGKAWLSTGVIFLLTTVTLADRMAISMLIGLIKQVVGRWANSRVESKRLPFR